MTVEKKEEKEEQEVQQPNVDVKKPEQGNEQQQPGESVQQYVKRIDTMSQQIQTLLDENKKIVAFNDTIKEEKRIIAEKAKNDILNAETKTKEEADNVIQQYKKELEDRDAKLSAIDLERQQARLDNKAKDLVKDVTKDASRQYLFAKEIKERIRLSPDGVVQVLDKQGNLTISSVDVLINDLKNEFPYLVDAVESTGGGGHSHAGTGAKAFKDMNSDEKVAEYNKDPNRYAQLETEYLAEVAAAKKLK